MSLDIAAVQATYVADRFTLRPLRTSDVGLITMFASDPALARATRSIPHPLPPGAMEAMIARASQPGRTEDVWVMDGSDDGHAEVLGLVSLAHMDRAQSELFYWVAPAFWHVGFATEAVRTLLAHNPHDAAQYFAEAFQDNPGSARVLTNCGFDYLGDAEAFSVARNALVPTWTYMLKMQH
ncbi:Protein N-acetyltransferase, RimJ/RimL family [Loktanella fryxellensis]|uniref:Protein N-acetyltransferase, RimJ/RimL family n=1 Tax=Loktanella fryxellensis TaxID=245187 RepID=A0A1H8F281_9RHOB|nr:GNAT family N-acetyltransferase [Loktanella fryxellensis]SEN25863.1 Protein N-acetyltransferase, RimJ/RimL family [Loktanella fryxellensis]